MGSVPTWALDKHTCRSLWISIVVTGLYFIPLNQILNVSLNEFRKRVATFHKILIGAQIEESSITLESLYQIIGRGTPRF
jgi:hypothetical protein